MSVIVPIGEGTAKVIISLPAVGKEFIYTFGVDTTTSVAPDLWPGLIYNALISEAVASPGNMAIGYQLEGVQVVYQDPTGPITYEEIDPSAGTASINPPPSNCAVLVSKRTASGGRRNRGRMYIPISDMNESSIDAAGGIVVATKNILQGRWDDFLAQLGVVDLEMLVHHDNGAAGTVVTQLVVEGQIATQRRRMR